MEPFSLAAAGLMGLGGIGQTIAGFQQAREAKKMLQFQKNQYNDWRNWTNTQSNNLASGLNEITGGGLLGRNESRKRSAGLLDMSL